MHKNLVKMHGSGELPRNVAALYRFGVGEGLYLFQYKSDSDIYKKQGEYEIYAPTNIQPISIYDVGGMFVDPLNPTEEELAMFKVEFGFDPYEDNKE